jgi:hypothetical protein
MNSWRQATRTKPWGTVKGEHFTGKAASGEILRTNQENEVHGGRNGIHFSAHRGAMSFEIVNTTIHRS